MATAITRTDRPAPPELTARLPPHNRDAEVGVLGAMIRDGDAAHDMLTRLRAEDFYLDSHQRVFRAIGRLVAAGRLVDAVAVFEELNAAGDTADAGGVAYLAELLDAAPTAASAEYHAAVVREKAKCRALAHLATEAVRDAYDQAEPADDLIARTGRVLLDLGADHLGEEDPAPLSALIPAAINRYDDAHTGRGRGNLIPTGFDALDSLTGGFGPGQLIVLGARPGTGKTSIGLRFADNAARRGVGVLFASLEMSEEECTDRLVAMAAEVQLPRLRGASRMDEGQVARVVAQAGPGGLAGRPLWVDDRPARTATQIAATARRHARRYGVKLLVVDYLQLLRPDNPRDPRYLQVGMSAKRLKELARESGLAVLALAQLSRSIESREDGRPRLSDLRDSGEVEQDADVVMMLHKLDDDELKPIHRVDLVVAKNRNGPTGTVTLDFLRPFARFDEPVPNC